MSEDARVDTAPAVDSARTDVPAQHDTMISDLGTDVRIDTVDAQSDALGAAVTCPPGGTRECVLGTDGQPLSRNGEVCTRNRGPFSTETGETFSPAMLMRCDGQAYQVYNQDFCDVQVTLVVVGVGYSSSVRQQAAMLENDVVQRYRECGLRVLYVLIDDNEERGGGPDVGQDFCAGWVRQYGLSGPVLRDPNSTLNPMFSVVPASVLFDSYGAVLYRQRGWNDATLQTQISDALRNAGANLEQCMRRN